MATRINNLNPEILQWGILRSGNDLDEFYIKFPKVYDWISGKTKPTFKQLESFANRVHMPFGYIFLDEPPTEEIPFPFFRSNSKPYDRVSLNVYHTIQILQERQDWLVNFLIEEGLNDLDFVGKFNVNSSVTEIVNDIKSSLGLNDNWAKGFKSWKDTLDYLSQKIEDIGIIVTFNGVVANNPHRKIDVNECRGFVLVDKKAPFIFINSDDAKAAQMFTIAHELAHIWLGQSAGFDISNFMPANDKLEMLCDQVAAELLVPKKELIRVWDNMKDFKRLSRYFKVSPIVIARRSLDLGLIPKVTFFQFYNDYIAEVRKIKENRAPGGDFYRTVRKRISTKFMNYLHSAVKSNRLLYRDAYKLSSLKGDTYSNFIKDYL